MRIAITGSSGLIGTALRLRFAADRYQIVRIVRREAGPGDVRWDPATGDLDPTALNDVDAVINLAGAGIGARRWTPAYQRKIHDSRTSATATLSRAIAAANNPPRVLLSASAVGWYGDTGDRPTDENGKQGSGFLADLCADWEAATEPAREVGTRVVTMRSGLVLAPHGGMLARLRPLFALGVGGRMGSGRQYWPWISLLDELEAIRFLLDHGLSGPVNLTGPEPVSNAEFTRTLGTILHRPTLLSVPSFALRAALGGFADEGVLISQRVVPTALIEAGFTHTHRTLEQALRWATSG
jgi:uncharacterized protein